MPTSSRFMILAVAGAWLFLVPPISAHQPGLSLPQVLDEALAAYKSLERQAGEAESGLDDGSMTRYLLTFALIGADRGDEASALYSDEEERRRNTQMARAMLVEVTGEAPQTPRGLPPLEEMMHRQLVSMSLARRGDFQKAIEQIEAFPDNGGKPTAIPIRSYEFLVKKQLEKGDVAGARQTLRKLWPLVRDLKDEWRVEWLIGLAELTSRAGEQAPAQKLCVVADAALSEIRKAPDHDAKRVYDNLRKLAIAHARSGNADRARELLAVCRAQAESFADARTKADEMCELELAHAEAAKLAGQDDVALAAYRRALKWAKEVNPGALAGLADALDESGFVSALLALGEGANYRNIALGQLDAGSKQAALETWEQMPMCLQKPATILEIAKVLHRDGATPEARPLVQRCAALDRPDGAPLDHVTIRAFVAAMLRAIGDDAAARTTLEELLASPRVLGSLDAKKAAAGEMISLGMFKQAYAAIQTIESPADRALPLANLAYDMLKAARN